MLIRPIKNTPTMVTASSAGSADAAYNPATSYALGARVFVADNGKTYECVQAPALDKNPATEPLYWMYTQPSNRWAMFDVQVSTATTTPGDLTCTVTLPVRCNSAAFFGLVGSAIFVRQRSAAGAVLSEHRQVLRSNPVDWYDYLYGEPEQVSSAVFTSLVPATGSSIEVTITGPAACAAMLMGNMFDLGFAEYGASTSIVDYSKKVTSTEGVQTLEPGRFARRLDIRFMQPAERYTATHRVLESVRATPCVLIGVPDQQDMYSPMTLLGFYRDFRIEVPYPGQNLCSIDFEGLT